MTLVDTSVWIDHLRSGLPRLASLLELDLVLTHPFVVGEVACGNLHNRREVLDLLSALPGAEPAHDREVMTLVEDRRLYGSGIGWIDVHLIASALLSDAVLWTLDKRLAETAARAGCRCCSADWSSRTYIDTSSIKSDHT